MICPSTKGRKDNSFQIRHEVFFCSWTLGRWRLLHSATCWSCCHRCLYLSPRPCHLYSQTVLLQWVKTSLKWLLPVDASWLATASATDDEMKPLIPVAPRWPADSGTASCDACTLLLWQGHNSEAALWKWEGHFPSLLNYFAPKNSQKFYVEAGLSFVTCSLMVP